MKKLEPRILFRNLAVELIIYGGLILAYNFFVLRWMGDWLLSIFNSNLTVYALYALGLIVIQGVFLDFVTTVLMKYIKLDQFGIRRILDVFSNR
ncbi:MAG: hypothetical protein K8R16_07525 [Anaerolineales bacterium]|nr:hypothetical protein [Anaerolineales bacterium]